MPLSARNLIYIFEHKRINDFFLKKFYTILKKLFDKPCKIQVGSVLKVSGLVQKSVIFFDNEFLMDYDVA